jgi:hypothetical protein
VRWVPFAAVLLSAAVVLSGCAQKSSTPTPSTSATVTTRSSSPTSSSPTNSTPSAPQQVFKQVFRYGNPNEPDGTYYVANGSKTLEVKVYVNTTAAGAYSVQGPGTPPSGKPYVVVIDANGAETKLEFDAVTAGTCQPSSGTSCPVESQPLTKSVAFSKAGNWKAGVRGTGSNVQADVTITAKFA